jgi:hypothetical protein
MRRDLSICRKPPSALPGISPIGGEISVALPSRPPVQPITALSAFGRHTALGCNGGVIEGIGRFPDLLSPLVGEMPGRAERGFTASSAAIEPKPRTPKNYPRLWLGKMPARLSASSDDAASA